MSQNLLSAAVVTGALRVKLFTYCVVFHDILSSDVGVFQNHLFQKMFWGIPSECHTVWIQIMADILSGLIWVQTVCKG